MRVVVCGSDTLAYRLVHELATIHGADVTNVRIDPAPDSPGVSDIPRVTVETVARLDQSVFDRVALASADAVAFVDQNDGGNIDAALLARECAPDVRIVMRIFDETLAESMHDLLADCVVLSATAVAAPAFVAAAEGGDEPTALRVADRLLYVTERADTRPADVLCVLSTESTEQVLGASDAPDDLVLTGSLVAGDRVTEAPARPTARSRAEHGARVRRRAGRRALLAVLVLVGRRVRVVGAVLLVLLAIATVALMAIRHVSVGQAAYLGVLTMIGGAVPDATITAPEKVLQVLLTIVSVAVIPATTAALVEAVVSARLVLAGGGLAVPARDHYVVVGLGDVGTRVLTALDDAGEAVVGIDTDPTARGVAVARQRRVPVVAGDGKLEATLRAADVGTARGLIALTGNDVTNLETALISRKLGPPDHTVMRIFDADFADRVQRAFGFSSRSVSSLAAPSFAAAILGRQIVATIPARRRVLLVVEVPIGAGSALEGTSVAGLDQRGEVQVIAIRTGRGGQTLWMPPPGRQLVRTDRVVAITTRGGLGLLVAASTLGTGAARPLPVLRAE